jgi:hypothetical protein
METYCDDAFVKIDKVEIQVLVDNATDGLSTTPANVETEFSFATRRGLRAFSGRCLCCEYMAYPALLPFITITWNIWSYSTAGRKTMHSSATLLGSARRRPRQNRKHRAVSWPLGPFRRHVDGARRDPRTQWQPTAPIYGIVSLSVLLLEQVRSG